VFVAYIIKINTFHQDDCASLLVGTDKYHIQTWDVVLVSAHYLVCHHLSVGKNALNEYRMTNA